MIQVFYIVATSIIIQLLVANILLQKILRELERIE